jgi:hypothetical protein
MAYGLAGLLMALSLCRASAQDVDLIGDGKGWDGGVDSAGAEMALSPTADAKLATRVTTDGAKEHYPKVRRAWAEPQDWSPYLRLRVKLRVTSPDPNVAMKRMSIVFYDDQTRRQDLPDHPWTQQVIAHDIPTGKWVELSDWLLNIHRATIRQFDLYLYDQPPASPHSYTWEFADLRLEGVGETAVLLDTEVYAKEEMAANRGRPVGEVKADDGLSLTLGSAGEVAGVKLDGRSVGAPDGQPTGLLVRDAATPEPPTMAGGRLEAKGGAVTQTATLGRLGLRLQATYRSAGTYLEVAGQVEDTRGEDRAVTVLLALPLAEAPWLWWDSMSTSRTHGKEVEELSYLETGVAYGQGGAHSKYPLGAVTWPGRAGLTAAVRMDEPVVHRIAYNPELKLLYLAADFALVPEKTVDGRSLQVAPFRFLLYRHDPAWGFRSALERYYGFFPEFFAKHAKREGGWFVWGDMRETAGALQAGFGFHWGPNGTEAVKWDNEHQVTSLLYIEPEFYQETLGDFTRDPTPAEAIERLDKVAAGDAAELAKMEKLGYAGGYAPANWVREHSLREALQTISKAALGSVEYGSDGRPYTSIGKFPWMSESQWGCIFPCNLDPTVPSGKGGFNRRVYLDYNLKAMEEAGAHYDGIGLDSLGGYGQHGRSPLTFSAMEHVPVKVAAFTTLEWVRELAKEMHDRGLVLMTNCSWGFTPGWLTFCAPYLDVFGAEAPQFADPDFIRAIAYRKPCTDLPYTPRPDWEVAWHLLHGIYPGAGNDVKVMAQHVEVLQELALAGWEPITCARADPATVRLERFGREGRIFLVAHNPTEEAVDATVTVDAKALGLARVEAMAVPGKGKATVAGSTITLHLEAHGTAVIVVPA